MNQMNHKFYLSLIMIVASVGGILYGFDLGVIAGALLYIQKAIALSTFETELVVGGVFAGGLIGTVLAGPIADSVGRRFTVGLSAMVFIVGIMAVISAHSFMLLMLGRLLLGAGIGLVAVAVPLYAVELAPARYRGRAVTTFQLFLTFGLVLAYFVDLIFAPSGNWRAMFATILIPASILLIGTFFLPKSPRFLIARGQLDKARQVLLKTCSAQEAERNIAEISYSLKSSEGSWRELFSKKWALALFVAGSIAFLQQLTGINSFLQYAPMILKDAGLSSNILGILGSIGIASVNLIMTVVAMFLVDSVGRKPLLLTGLIGIIVAEVALHFIHFLPFSAIAKGWLSLAGLLTFILFYALGPGVVVWLAMSELFATRIRGKGLAFCLFLNSLGSTILASSFLTLIHKIGVANVYLICASATFLYWLVARYGLPETRGHSLEAIQEQVENKDMEVEATNGAY